MTKTARGVKLPGKKEIESFLDGYFSRAGSLVKVEDLNAEKLYMLVGSNIGWYWNVEDVGSAPDRHTGEPSSLAGLYVFLDAYLSRRRR